MICHKCRREHRSVRLKETDAVAALCRDLDISPTAFRKHRLTAEQAIAIYDAQHGACAICQRTPDEIPTTQVAGKSPDAKLCIDHDHETGAVRGFLCARCNSGLGLFGDDPDTIVTAACYVRAKTLVAQQLLTL